MSSRGIPRLQPWEDVNSPNEIQIKIIVEGNMAGNSNVGTISKVTYEYGRENGENWKRWKKPDTFGDPAILTKIEKVRKDLESLENEYKASMKPKVEYVPGTAYKLDHIYDGYNVGVFLRKDGDDDYVFIVGDNTDGFIWIDRKKVEAAEVKPLNKPNQKKAAEIIYDFFTDGKFPE